MGYHWKILVNCLQLLLSLSQTDILSNYTAISRINFKTFQFSSTSMSATMTFFEFTNFQFKNSKFLVVSSLKSVTNYGLAWFCQFLDHCNFTSYFQIFILFFSCQCSSAQHQCQPPCPCQEQGWNFAFGWTPDWIQSWWIGGFIGRCGGHYFALYWS